MGILILEVLQGAKFRFNIGRATSERNFDDSIGGVGGGGGDGGDEGGGLHGKHAVQRAICSITEESHGKPWSSWPVPGTSGRKLFLASSQTHGP
jgi:hypothetical protein